MVTKSKTTSIKFKTFCFCWNDNNTSLESPDEYWVTSPERINEDPPDFYIEVKVPLKTKEPVKKVASVEVK